MCLVVASCGGGEENSSTPTLSKAATVQTIPSVIAGKVIDGYVSGASIYIDVNWSMSHETGEPITVSGSDGSWQFTQEQVSNFQCWQDRPIVVNVPAGAVDSDRGVVSVPYTMLHLPGSWVGSNQTNVNLTPFTTLFAVAISDIVSSTSISVGDGCSSQSNNVATLAKKEVESFAVKMKDIGVDISTFYNDYILSNDTAAQQKGELIVDYLAAYQQISKRVTQSIQTNLGATGQVRSFYNINFDVIKQIIDTNPQSVSFDLSVYSNQLTMPTNESGNVFLVSRGTRLRNDGLVVDSLCGEDNIYGCQVVNVETDTNLIKASSYSRRVIKFTNRSVVFTKKNNTCSNMLSFSTPTVEFNYRSPIVDATQTYGCNKVDQGVQFSRQVSHQPTSNGYTYSLFRYYGTTVPTLQYLSSYISTDPITTQFDSAQALSELQQLPYSPNQIDTIVATYGSSWILQTGSNTEDAVFRYDGVAQLFMCTVFTKNTNNKLRETIGTKQDALAMCYPDLSVYN